MGIGMGVLSFCLLQVRVHVYYSLRTSEAVVVELDFGHANQLSEFGWHTTCTKDNAVRDQHAFFVFVLQFGFGVNSKVIKSIKVSAGDLCPSKYRFVGLAKHLLVVHTSVWCDIIVAPRTNNMTACVPESWLPEIHNVFSVVACPSSVGMPPFFIYYFFLTGMVRHDKQGNNATTAER